MQHSKVMVLMGLLFLFDSAQASTSASATAGSSSSGNLACGLGEDCSEAHAVGGAYAWADALSWSGPGSARAVATATSVNLGMQTASASANTVVDGGAVLVRGGGGIGDVVTLRGRLVIESDLDYSLSGIAGTGGSCCSISSILALNVTVERKDPVHGYVGASDFEFDITDQFESVAPPINRPFSNTQSIAILENGNGVLSPLAEGAYLNGDPISFAFQMGYADEFRVRLNLEVSVKADASTNPGCVMFNPDGGCVVDSTLDDNIASISLDAGHSLYWAGLEASDAAGNPVQIVSTSGFDLSQNYFPLVSVPLPASAYLFLSGLAGLLTATRRGRLVRL